MDHSIIEVGKVPAYYLCLLIAPPQLDERVFA